MAWITLWKTERDLETLINQWGKKIMAGVDDLKKGVTDVENTETATLTMLTNLKAEIDQLKLGGGLSDADQAALAQRLETAIGPVQALVNPPTS
jgi:hypothetical protein